MTDAFELFELYKEFLNKELDRQNQAIISLYEADKKREVSIEEVKTLIEKSINDAVNKLKDDINNKAGACNSKLQEMIKNVSDKVIALQVKSGVWGLLGGAIPTVVVLAYMAAKD